MRPHMPPINQSVQLIKRASERLFTIRHLHQSALAKSAGSGQLMVVTLLSERSTAREDYDRLTSLQRRNYSAHSRVRDYRPCIPNALIALLRSQEPFPRDVVRFETGVANLPKYLTASVSLRPSVHGANQAIEGQLRPDSNIDHKTPP